MKGPLSKKGFTLVETTLGVALFLFIIASLLVVTNSISHSMAQAKENLAGERLMQMGLSRLQNIPFWQLLDMDSDLNDFGLVGSFNYKSPEKNYSTYPSSTVLKDYLTAIRAAGFQRFTVSITYWRRDLSDTDSDGFTTDLVKYRDLDSNNVDDFDWRVRRYDKNGDGDFYDVYISTETQGMYANQLLSEMPSTNMREVLLQLYKNGEPVMKKSAMINLGQFSGEGYTSAENALQLRISTPSDVVHEYDDGPEIASYDRVILLPHRDFYSTRVDGGQLMQVGGVTEANAIVRILKSDGSVLETISADANGKFNVVSSALDSYIRSDGTEGQNYFVAFSSKDSDLSPYANVGFIWDSQPPVITNWMPVGSTTNKNAPVGAYLKDSTVSTTSVSGIAVPTIALIVNGSSVPYIYNATNQFVSWFDTTTLITPVLYATVTYNMTLEAGDNAGYKTSQSWQFTVAPNMADVTPPQFGPCEDFNIYTVRRRVWDHETGIRANGVEVEIDGAPVPSYYDALTGYVNYSAPASLLGQTVEFKVTVANWLDIGDPAHTDTQVCMVTVDGI